MSAKVFHPIPHDLKEGCLAMDGRRNGLHIPKRRKVALCDSSTREMAELTKACNYLARTT